MTSSLQVQIRGAGLTGSLAALAFAQSGWNVCLEDHLGIEQLQDRSRAYALTHSSRRLLQKLNLWKSLQEHLVPFKWLTLRDREIDREVLFGLDDLPQQPSDAVGWTVQHRPLIKLLFVHLQSTSVKILLGNKLSESNNYSYSKPRNDSLILVCEGGNSSTRNSLGIGLWSFRYNQSCLTAVVKLRGGSTYEAFELFRAEGPFAVLPLGNDLFQIVWSTSPQRCKQLEKMEPVTFLDALSSVLPKQLQPEALIDKPRTFPVSCSLVHKLHNKNMIMVGEVAHCSHPVGGQGLNLCWRDVAILHHLASLVSAGKLKQIALPSAYARRRWIDIIITLMITDFLVRLFSNRIPSLMLVRRLAFNMFSWVPFLRRTVLGMMTEGPSFFIYLRTLVSDYPD
uniref:Possible 2-octaprenyl-6-methoxyphenol 4-monoxygenase; UbiH n=1 Tax=Paulinella chromatophora TaxID=39717 RepID=B1X5J9_PAUCH|nr:possible 2-octaprenyl-6-methoxyphenol 4- monoxygenase; UbiH [Paulinella chromatophora]ACB43218.1 possible 2-octaprenyl-6-methoxyphenol 4- monoxygenase; UbiH [Paulinella chromatophora]